MNIKQTISKTTNKIKDKTNITISKMDRKAHFKKLKIKNYNYSELFKKMKPNKQVVITSAMVLLLLSAAKGVFYVKDKIQLADNLQQKLHEMEAKVKFTESDTQVYKYLYDQTNTELTTTKSEKEVIETSLESTKEELQQYKDLVSASKQYSIDNYSRSGLEEKDLTNYEILSVDQMNTWIAERAPKNSPFIGRGDVFLSAAKGSGLDPKYIAAHAALESAWGTYNIAKNKHNYFGINATNVNPGGNAYSFNSFEDGIVSGAKWIKKYYTDKGKTSISDMLAAGYSQNDDGSPNTSWKENIVSIMVNDK
mgnify:CR=1 FL=1